MKSWPMSKEKYTSMNVCVRVRSRARVRPTCFRPVAFNGLPVFAKIIVEVTRAAYI